MPGPMVHLIVQQRLSGKLREFGNTHLADILDGDPSSPYAAFGSIGPDFLFFSMREYPEPIADLTNFIFGVYDAFEPFLNFYEENIEPVLSDIDHALRTADEALFQGLFGRIRGTSERISTTLLTAAASVLTSETDLFYCFYPKIQAGLKEKNWYWFDLLHYRRTGQFASAMWSLAEGNPDLQRYVLGYVSHIASDVVGHPFVNTITGGPYRTHWHRHKLVENWIDAYARRFYGDTSTTLRGLNLTRSDRYTADAISRSYYHRLVTFDTGAVTNLPPQLAQMFKEALDLVYTDGPDALPESLTVGDIDSAYRLWLTWFKRSTEVGDAQRPPPPPRPPGSAARSLINSYTAGLPPAPGGLPTGGGFSLLGIFEALLAFARYLVEVLLYTLDWLIHHAGDILSLPLDTGLELLNWMLYQLQKAVYKIYDTIRFSLVLGAYLFPEPRDLNVLPWGRALTNTAFAHTTGMMPAEYYEKYPLRQEDHGFRGTIDHHLVYPLTAPEDPAGMNLHGEKGAEAMPHPFYGQNPEVFITQEHPYQDRIEDLYNAAGPFGSGTNFTHFIDQQTWQTPQFGSALSFSARLMIQRLEILPNFNLDGDRGYGWKCWRLEDIEPLEENGAPCAPLDVLPPIETEPLDNIRYLEP